MTAARRVSSRPALPPPGWLASTLAGACLACLWPVLGSIAAGCSSEAPESGGRRVVLHSRTELAPGAATFTNGYDYRVSLTKVVISAAGFRYLDGVPPIALAPPRPEERSWFSALRVAHAHPGHYDAGSVLGEMTVPAIVNLLDGPSELADGGGVSGTYRSARFSFGAPPDGTPELEGHAVLVEGSAELEGEEPRYFRALAAMGEIAASAPGGNVDGCVFEAAAVERDGTVTLAVQPREWFTLVDFGELEPGSADAPVVFVKGSQASIAFAQGVAEISAYRFSFRPD